jgi:hypothetical protein
MGYERWDLPGRHQNQTGFPGSEDKIYPASRSKGLDREKHERNMVRKGRRERLMKEVYSEYFICASLPSGGTAISISP